MSPIKQFRVLAYIAFPIGGIMAGIMAEKVSSWFALLMFVWALFIFLLIQRISCSNCGHRIGYGKFSFGKCEQCGNKF